MGFEGRVGLGRDGGGASRTLLVGVCIVHAAVFKTIIGASSKNVISSRFFFMLSSRSNQGRKL